MYGGTELPDAGLKDMPMLQSEMRRKVETNLKKAVGEMHRDVDPSSADLCLSEMNYLFGNAKRIDSIPDTFFHRRNSDLDYTGTMFRHENEEEENEDDDEDTEKRSKTAEDENMSQNNMLPPLRLKSGTPTHNKIYVLKFVTCFSIS